MKLTDLFDYGKMPASGANVWGTYHAFTGKGQQAWPTDLIFYGGALQVESASEMVRDQGADGRWPSDHFFVMGSVGWK